MKVYILTVYDMEQSVILGVFTSQMLATEAADTAARSGKYPEEYYSFAVTLWTMDGGGYQSR